MCCRAGSTGLRIRFLTSAVIGLLWKYRVLAKVLSWLLLLEMEHRSVKKKKKKIKNQTNYGEFCRFKEHLTRDSSDSWVCGNGIEEFLIRDLLMTSRWNMHHLRIIFPVSRRRGANPVNWMSGHVFHGSHTATRTSCSAPGVQLTSLVMYEPETIRFKLSIPCWILHCKEL